jgi:hypothetical protein
VNLLDYRALRALRATSAPGRLSAAARAIARSPARWDLAAAALYTAWSLVLYAASPAAHTPASDGTYSWIYARSLAYDHDLDFTNDYALCGDRFGIGTLTDAHRPANIFYLGPAVFWTPLIWLLKHVAPNADAGGCSGAISTIVLGLSSFAGGAVVLLTSALLRRVVAPRAAALASLVAALGGHLVYFTTLNPSYSHAYDALCVVAFLYGVARLRERGANLPGAAVAGLLLGLAILQRSSNGVFFVVAAGAMLWPWPATGPRKALGALGVVATTAFLSGVVPLAWANAVIFGHPSLYVHGPHFLRPGHAHPLLLLFDLRGGFFAFAPLWWLSVPGLLLLARRRDLRWLAGSLAVAATFELYVSASALDWQAGRRLTNLTPLFALGLALAGERAVGWLRARSWRIPALAAAAVVAVAAWPNGSVAYSFSHDKITWDAPLAASDSYGESGKQLVAAIEGQAGALGAWPMSWAFALRYGLRPIAFGPAAHPKWFERNPQTLAFVRSDFDFTASEARPLLRGLRTDVDGHPGACMAGTAAAAVFATQWPAATRARLVYTATRPERLEATVRSPLGATTVWTPEGDLQPGKLRQVYFRVPPGGLDSGLHEILLARESDAALLCLHRLDFVDDAAYSASPYSQASSPVQALHVERYQDDDAAAPSVAVGVDGPRAWMVEVHEEKTAGRLAFCAGRLDGFQTPATYESHGFRPRVAIASGEGAVVEVHQASPSVGPLYFRTGRRASSDGGPGVLWSPAAPHGSGQNPAIAAMQGQVVEILEGGDDGRSLVYGTGRLGSDGAIAWSDIVPFEDPAGTHPAVALGSAEGRPDDVVVEVHQVPGTDPPNLAYRTGYLDAAGAIRWRPPVVYDQGWSPTVAVHGSTVVEAHQAKAAEGSLWMTAGTIGADGAVSWRPAREYDHGVHPSLAADPLHDDGIETHAGAASFGSLWWRALAVH